MREIKFRAFNRHSETMEYITLQELADGNGLFFDFETYDWQQFTGLLDKNGKEIYEGDVLKVNDENRKVVSAEGGWVLRTTYKQEFNGGFSPKFLHRHFHDYLEAPDRLFVEVIGNVYDNPELLAKE